MYEGRTVEVGGEIDLFFLIAELLYARTQMIKKTEKYNKITK
jgi:hypothetical protein